MSGGEEDDEIYSNQPSSSPVPDMRLKIAMFDKPSGTSTSKQKLTQQLTRNGIGPKPPAKSPLKQQESNKAATPAFLPPKTGKLSTKPNEKLSSKQQESNKAAPPAFLPPKTGKLSTKPNEELSSKQQESNKVAPPAFLPPKTGKLSTKPNEKLSPEPRAPSPKKPKDEGARAVKSIPFAVGRSIFHNTDGNRTASPVNLSDKNNSLYPPDQRHTNCDNQPRRTQNCNLFKADGKTYRKLPFVVPKGPAPKKPQKTPVLTMRLGQKTADIEEIYEDTSSYEKEPDNDADDNAEEDYEDVGEFSETFRK